MSCTVEWKTPKRWRGTKGQQRLLTCLDALADDKTQLTYAEHGPGVRALVAAGVAGADEIMGALEQHGEILFRGSF